MDEEQIDHMAKDFAAWVEYWSERIRQGVTIGEDGQPNLDSPTLRELRREVEHLNAEAARYAVMAALIGMAAAKAGG